VSKMLTESEVFKLQTRLMLGCSPGLLPDVKRLTDHCREVTQLEAENQKLVEENERLMKEMTTAANLLSKAGLHVEVAIDKCDELAVESHDECGNDDGWKEAGSKLAGLSDEIEQFIDNCRQRHMEKRESK